MQIIMRDPFEPIDLSCIKTYPLSARNSKVNARDFAVPWEPGKNFKSFLAGLPNILASKDLMEIISAIAKAYRNDRLVVLAMGAHVIKVGLNPIVIDLIRRGIIRAVAMNGAGIIHDLELAMTGRTSEDVAASLGDGSFGMARETGAFLSDAIRRAGETSSGLGKTIGTAILEEKLPFCDGSLLAAAVKFQIPITVHVAIGTDIIHMHPGFDAKSAGHASHIDFRTFAGVVSRLEDGVYINLGSAVILPEVFLKAITLTRNLGYRLENITTVNMDFIRHYRPMTNVVNRPTSKGGMGYNLVGHHEIMFPILAAGVIEKISSTD